LNLVINARDALPPGGSVRITATNESVDSAKSAVVHGAKPGDYVCVSVSDSGVGMDATTLAQCLDPYFTTRPPGKGTGLGLASMAGTAEQAGGLLHIESEPGVGTTASIYFPRSLEPELEAAEPTGGAIASPSSDGIETVLLVEDEP